MSERPTVKIGHLPITDHLVVGVLSHLIGEGAKEPENFELETVRAGNWKEIAEALSNGTVDAACVLAPLAMNLFAKGTDIRVLLFAHRGGSIMVRSRKGIYKPPYEDYYRGRTFLIPHPLSVHHALAHMFFSGFGLTASLTDPKADVKLEVAPPLKMGPLLAADEKYCGFFVAEPVGTKAIAGGAARLQFLSNELWSNHPCCVVAVGQKFLDEHSDAAIELTEMLIDSGDIIEKRPGEAAAIAVDFLDPQKKLGLKRSVLKNVLTEEYGITTGDLFPTVDDLNTLQHYLHDTIGEGQLIDVEKLVDTRYAEMAYEKLDKSSKVCVQMADPANNEVFAAEILERSADAETDASKTNLELEGQYLTFELREDLFAVDILRVREITQMLPIRSVPNMPPDYAGVVQIRGEVIPVFDLASSFGMGKTVAGEQTCILILERENEGRTGVTGVIVDEVVEVVPLDATSLHEVPFMGQGAQTEHLCSMASLNDRILMIIDSDQILA